MSFLITLATCPNPDHGETRAPKKTVVVAGSLEDVLAAGRSYSEDIGGGNWAGGHIDRLDGDEWVPFARMSYNGRVFAPNGQALYEPEPEHITPVVHEGTAAWTKIGSRRCLRIAGSPFAARQDDPKRHSWVIFHVPTQQVVGLTMGDRQEVRTRLIKTERDHLTPKTWEKVQHMMTSNPLTDPAQPFTSQDIDALRTGVTTRPKLLRKG